MEQAATEECMKRTQVITCTKISRSQDLTRLNRLNILYLPEQVSLVNNTDLRSLVRGKWFATVIRK